MPARISDSSKSLTSLDTGVSADAGVTLESLRAHLKNATLDVVWRQWRLLDAGAAARIEEGRASGALIDAEALVLVSLALMSEERRLADLLHDWGARNADLLSVQRVKNLVAQYPAEVQRQVRERLTWFATIARDDGKDLRWRSVIGPRSAADENDGAAHRRPATVRATRARLRDDAALMLRMRLGFGVGVKADAMTYLLAGVEEWTTVREISEAVAYTPAAVRRAADDLAAARLVESLEGQPARYRVSYEPWRALLGLEERPPRWASWQERFVFTTAFLHWADTAAGRPLSSYALGAQGREFLERYRTALERDLVVVWSAHTKIENWPEFLGRAVHALAAWMEGMA